MQPTKIGLIGDYNPDVVAHQAIPDALHYAAEKVETMVQTTWIHTGSLSGDIASHLSKYDALWCVPASPYENFVGALTAIQFARERSLPFLGT